VELFIADDFSTDNSVEVIEKWLTNHPEIPFFANKENIGNTKTFN
jgi:glycosyltransferase involved in cell wall biosynthesis